MIIVDGIEQGTDAWHQLRIGNPGASSFKRIVTTKGIRSKSAQEYIDELTAEVITGQKTRGYSNDNMEEGLAMEQESRSWYEMQNEVDVQQVALCYPDERKLYHCSPDGIMPELNRGWETKNAKGKIQIARLRSRKLPTEHYAQCQGSLLVTGYETWDFQSYSRGLPVMSIRVERDEKFIDRLRSELEAFCQELAYTVREIKEMQR